MREVKGECDVVYWGGDVYGGRWLENIEGRKMKIEIGGDGVGVGIE